MSIKLKHHLLTQSVGGLLVIVIFISGCSSSSSQKENLPSISEVPSQEKLVEPLPIENSDNISRENFNKIKNGMTLLEVEMIIAGTNEKISTRQIDDKKIETYKWETTDRTKSIEVTFENEIAVGKNETGLR